MAEEKTAQEKLRELQQEEEEREEQLEKIKEEIENVVDTLSEQEEFSLLENELREKRGDITDLVSDAPSQEQSLLEQGLPSISYSTDDEGDTMYSPADQEDDAYSTATYQQDDGVRETYQEAKTATEDIKVGADAVLDQLKMYKG